MSKNLKGVIAILIVLGIAFAVYWLTRKKSPVMDKKAAIKTIAGAKSGRSEQTLSSYGEDYLIAWAQAIQAAQATFMVAGKNYNTNSGMTIK